MTEAVIGWVDGAPVPSSALAPYMAGVAARPAGARLGVTTEPDALVGPAHSRADGLRTWGTKALLVETLLKAEAARLGVNEAASPSDWLARLEANGELAGPAPTEAEVEAYHAANPRRFRVKEARRARHVLLADEEPARRLLEAAPDAATLGSLAAGASRPGQSRPWRRPGLGRAGPAGRPAGGRHLRG